MAKTVKELRINDIGKERIIVDQVTQIDSIKPLCTSAKFECPQCGNIVEVLQPSIKFLTPTRCGCGRVGKFRLLSKKMIDSQVLYFGNKEKTPVILTDTLIKHKIKEGDQIRVIGIIKSKPYIYNRGVSRFNYYQIKAKKIAKDQ